MKKKYLFSIAFPIGLAMLPAVSPSAPDSDFARGCRINLKASYRSSGVLGSDYGGDTGIRIKGSPGSGDTKVRIRSGTWRNWPTYLGAGMRNGGDYQAVHELRLGCNNQRRYRFHVELWARGSAATQRLCGSRGLPISHDVYGRPLCTAATRQVYYPSPNSFTKNTTINLGNLAEAFK